MKPLPQPLRALLVEDSEDDALLLVEALRSGGYAPDWQRVETETALREALAAQEWDVVFCDYSMPGLDARSALRVLRETGDMITAIVISGQVGEEVAVEAMRMGANDFVLKHKLDQVVPAIERDLPEAELRRERQDAALALRQSEERYRMLFDKSPWPMWVYDPVTLRYLAVNEMAIKEYGYTREECLGMTIKEMRPPEDVPALLAYFDAMKTGAEAPPQLRRHRKKDGSVIPVEIVNQPITYNGQVARVVQAIDITARKQAAEALRISEERFRRYFDLGLVGLAITSSDKGCLEVNDTFCQILGYERQELLEMNWADLTHPDDLSADVANFRQVLAGEKDGYSMEKRFIRKDGRVVYSSISVRCVRHGDGSVDYFVALLLDLTERKAGELALRESEERFRQMAENSNDVFWMTDLAKNRVIYISPAYESIWGRTCESLYAEPASASVLDTIHPEDQQRVDAAFSHPIEGSFDLDYRIVRLDGAHRWIHHRAYPVKNEAGEIYRLAGIASDITEAKHATKQIFEQAALLDHAQDAILVQDLEGRVKYWNKSAERVFGWTAQEALGRKVQEFLCESAESYDISLKATLSQGDWIGEMTKCTKSGGDALVAGRWTLVRDETGKPTAILAINTDITEKKKTEAQYFRAQRMENIGMLAGGIAHDLNNVLGPIIMAVELLKRRITDPRDRHLLELMETSGHRGADMVKQVLLFARGIEGRRVPLSPVQLVKEFERIIHATFPKSISIEADISEETWKLAGDRTQLHQVLLNLCVNARDAMPRGGRLRLSARNRLLDEHMAAMHPESRPGPYVTLEVADTGEGMTPEVLERIFEPFFTTKEIGKGTGLGLSTTHAIVKNHGGFITVESEPGKGAVFQVNLPAESEPAKALPEALAQEFPRGDGEMILIIDDEASIRSITGQTLEAFGYRVMSAGDGVEGVAQYAQHPGEIAAVLTDMMMPVMDGPATIRILMRLNPEVKIIAVSGADSQAVEAAVPDAGVKYFLPKPYNVEALLRTLSQLLHPGA